MNDQRRLILTVILSVLVIAIWQKFFMPRSALLGQLGPDASVSVADGGGELAQGVADAGAVVPSRIPPLPAQPGPRPPEELVIFDSPKSHLVFSSYGGALQSAVLKGNQFKREVEGKDVQVDLVHVRRSGQPEHPGPDPLPLSLALENGLPALGADAAYRVNRTSDGVTFTASVGPLELVKRYRIGPSGYDVELDATITNRGAGTLVGDITVLYDGFAPKGEEVGGGFLMRGPVDVRLPIARVNEKTERHGEKEKGPTELKGPVSFGGLDERYFLAAIYPVKDTSGTVTLSSSPEGLKQAALTFPVGPVAPGGSVTRTFGVFLGPKLAEPLEQAGSGLAGLKGVNPELSSSVDYGMVAVISQALLVVMRFFHGIIPNWGVAILLLTLAVKVVLLPLTHKQMASMEAMRRLQPKIQALQKKYKEDKERLNIETMKLYQENKVNPLGGCLPMIVQMPVWWGLYRTLEYAFDLYRQPFIPHWVNDLSAYDPTYILPIVMGVTMFVSQRLQPQVGDSTQAKVMMYVMPVFFSAIMFKLPAGLNLYIFFNNILSIIQQMWLRKRFPPPVAMPVKT